MRGWLRSAVTVAVALVTVMGAVVPAGAEDSPTVQRARARLEAARAEAAAATQAYVDAVGLLGRTEVRVAGLEARIPRLEAKSTELRELLAQRAADLYSGGNASGLIAVQQAIDRNDLTQVGRAAHLADAAQADVDANADEYEATQASLEATRDELKTAREEQAAQADVDANADEYEATQASLEATRDELKTAREEQAAQADEAGRHSDEVNVALERANSILREAEQEQSLQRYFAAMQAQQNAALAAALAALSTGGPPPDEPDAQQLPADPALAGEIPVLTMPCPVTGLVTFVDDWGQPRSGWRVHQGTDMFAPAGTPNIAVGNGVARAKVGGLGGNSIWLVTDDGHAYYYAHLERFEGVFAEDGTRRVVQGEVVGYTGNTGNAAGGPMHTHFQIHPRATGPLNPFPLLRDMCAIPSAPPPPPAPPVAPDVNVETTAPVAPIAGP